MAQPHNRSRRNPGGRIGSSEDPPPSLWSRVKGVYKTAVFRVLRPAFLEMEQRLEGIEASLRLERTEGAKYDGEIRYWRYLIEEGGAEEDLGEPFEVVFGRWQRHRLIKLGEYLGLPRAEAEGGIDDWCASRSVVEIGAGPYPAVAAARKGWKRCVAIDPLAKGYVDEGLLPAACDGVVYVEALGENIPLPGSFADLVIIENCLDHVTNPEAVVSEILRLLKPGGLLWFFVDLSNHTDWLHPHAMNEQRVRALLKSFQIVREEVSHHKAHPKAYGGLRGLYRKPPVTEFGGNRAPSATVHVRSTTAPFTPHAAANGTRPEPAST